VRCRICCARWSGWMRMRPERRAPAPRSRRGRSPSPHRRLGS